MYCMIALLLFMHMHACLYIIDIANLNFIQNIVSVLMIRS